MEEHKDNSPQDVPPQNEQTELPQEDINGASSTSTSSSQPAELPLLPYNLREHKRSIVLYWFAIFAESFLLPISLYYGLSKGTDMRPGAYFAIITAMFGFVTGLEYALRGWRLIIKDDKYRPLNGSKRFWQFDSVMWILQGPYFVMTAVMIGVSIPDPPKTRGLAVILPIGMVMVATEMVASGIANWRGWKIPYRLSSHVAGSVCPPLTFSILEDIVACDGRGGKAFREAAMARYHASPRYRKMLVQLNWAWALSAYAIAGATFAIVMTIEPEVGYGLGWGIPTLWAFIGAGLTTLWVKRSVRIEHELWNGEKRPVA
jgi:hypothetical protein